MLVLITYDVNTSDAAGRGRLRRIAKECVNYGQRVQNSVFECLLDTAQCRKLQNELCKIIDPEKDSLRFYYLGKKYENKIEHFGCKQTYLPEEPMIQDLFSFFFVSCPESGEASFNSFFILLPTRRRCFSQVPGNSLSTSVNCCLKSSSPSKENPSSDMRNTSRFLRAVNFQYFMCHVRIRNRLNIILLLMILNRHTVIHIGMIPNRDFKRIGVLYPLRFIVFPPSCRFNTRPGRKNDNRFLAIRPDLVVNILISNKLHLTI